MNKKINIKLLPKGRGPGHGAPVNVAFVNVNEFEKANITIDEGLNVIARYLNAPAAINVFDMERAITTTSDGLIAEGAIITFAASDAGKIHPEFGKLHCKERKISPATFAREPHLRMGYELYPQKKLYIGPDPAKKLVPLHNVTISGRTVNNNSGTEVMDCVTMEEMLLPILGQLQIMSDEDILWGNTGPHISVGIGCTIVEDYSRSQPFMKCKPGDTAHNAGPYAKTLKAKLPCIVAPKEVLAGLILDALDFGLRPARELGCSPAVLFVAAYYGVELFIDDITPAARLELEALNIDLDKLAETTPKLSRDEIIAKADQIIPGVEKAERVPSTSVIEKIAVPL